MASKAGIIFLCLSVGLASGHGGINGAGEGDSVMESSRNPLTADEGEHDGQSVHAESSFTPLAAVGLTDLMHRMVLFSHALNLSTSQPEGVGDENVKEQRVNAGLAELIHRMELFSHALNLSRAPHEAGGGDSAKEQRVSEGLVELVRRMTLLSQAFNLSSTLHESGGGSDGSREQRVSVGLAELVHRMTVLSEALRNGDIQLLPASPIPPSSTTTTPGPRQQPCLPPFEEIAYRMCILQEMQLKLSWNDAQEFCWERGAELAEDMTVIKTRRYLNGLYGEEGTRSRWPVWVGGRRIGQTWRWARNLAVPDFLWAPNEPRVFSSDLIPDGLCMILDGYRRFYGASLPCHVRRRFVCQLRN